MSKYLCDEIVRRDSFGVGNNNETYLPIHPELINFMSVNRYQLLKIVQKYGTIEKFDLLFHRSGPQAGQPRGYAFVTYKEAYNAERAKNTLHNARLGTKNIVVRWAHSVSEVLSAFAIQRSKFVHIF